MSERFVTQISQVGDLVIQRTKEGAMIHRNGLVIELGYWECEAVYEFLAARLCEMEEEEAAR